jgi:hypothetical protein
MDGLAQKRPGTVGDSKVRNHAVTKHRTGKLCVHRSRDRRHHLAGRRDPQDVLYRQFGDARGDVLALRVRLVFSSGPGSISAT